MKLAAALLFAAATAFLAPVPARAAEEPAPLIPNVVDFSKLLPFLPNPPADWTADKAEGSTEDIGGAKITNVHRDYKKGDADTSPTASISILDSAANPDYVEATISAWNTSESTAEGYSKTLTIEEMPGFEAYENENKHGTLWLMVAKRYVLTIETQNLDAPELQAWLKRIDVKKLAEVK